MRKNKAVVPQEVADLFHEHRACLRLRDHACKMPLGYRKARKAAIDAEKALDRFKRRCLDIYPYLDFSDMHFDADTRMLNWGEEEDVEVEIEWAPVQCRACGGAGRVNPNGYPVPCPRCGGPGEISRDCMVPNPDGMTDRELDYAKGWSEDWDKPSEEDEQ